MVRVVARGRVSIYVYPEEGQPHDRPHCHVYWPDGEAVVGLGPVEILAGSILPAVAHALLKQHLSSIKDTWNSLNPRRPVV